MSYDGDTPETIQHTFDEVVRKGFLALPLLGFVRILIEPLLDLHQLIVVLEVQSPLDFGAGDVVALGGCSFASTTVHIA